MTHTTREEHVRGAIGGVVIALAAVIAIFAFASLTEAQTPSANVGTTTVNNGADAAIGPGGILNTRQTCSADGQCYPYTAPVEPGANTQFTADGIMMNGTATTTNGAVAGTTTESVMGTTTSAVGTANATGTDAVLSPSGLTPSANLGTQSGTIGASSIPAPLIAAEPANAPMPMVVDIDRDGSALIRGVVQSVGTSSLSLGSWGGAWKVRVAPDTEISPTRLSGIMPGDFVGAFGVLSATEAFTVNASVVRNWTIAPPTGAPITPGAVTAPVSPPSVLPSPMGNGGAGAATGTPAGGGTMTSTPPTSPSGTGVGTTTGGNAATGTPAGGETLPF